MSQKEKTTRDKAHGEAGEATGGVDEAVLSGWNTEMERWGLKEMFMKRHKHLLLPSWEQWYIHNWKSVYNSGPHIQYQHMPET